MINRLTDDFWALLDLAGKRSGKDFAPELLYGIPRMGKECRSKAEVVYQVLV